MKNHLLRTSKALCFSATKNLLRLKILIDKIIGSLVVLLQLMERQIFLNEVIDVQHFARKRAYFKRK